MVPQLLRVLIEEKELEIMTQPTIKSCFFSLSYPCRHAYGYASLPELVFSGAGV